MEKRNSKKKISEKTMPKPEYKEKKDMKLSTTRKEIVLKDKIRSESVSRQISKLSESPTKSQSMDRSKKSKSNNIILESTSTKNLIYDQKKEISKAGFSSENLRIKDINLKTHSSKQNSTKKPKNLSDVPIRSELKSNAQVAKSFVKSSQQKQKVSKTKKLQLKTESASNSFSIDTDRPKTSTLKKNVDPEITYLNNSFDITDSPCDRIERPSTWKKGDSKNDSEDDKASYEEDFEDYDSDFEESEEDSMSSSNESIIDEKETLKTDQTYPSNFLLPDVSINKETKSDLPEKNSERTFLKMSDRSSLMSKIHSIDKPSPKPMKLSHSFIDFAAAIEKEVTENDKLVKENSPEVNAFDSMYPLENLEMPAYQYVPRVKPNHKHIYIQTENIDDENVQTEDIEISHKWTQNPVYGNLACGSDQSREMDESDVSWKSLYATHSTKLSSFLQWSSNVILTLLDEEFPRINTNRHMQKRPNFFQNDSYYSIFPLKFMKDVSIAFMCCCPNSPYLITTYGCMSQSLSLNTLSVEKGILCIWNILESKEPEYILTCNSQPTCCSFNPNGNDIVVAGMIDGSIVLWDLAELGVTAIDMETEEKICVHSPTYNTALILGKENHTSFIVKIYAVQNHEKNDFGSSSHERRGSTKNFHVLSLEDMGIINVWVAVEVLKTDITGFESDLGLAPGGRYRLVKSSTIDLHNSIPKLVHLKTGIRTFDFAIFPRDPSRVLVTTDNSIILNVTRHNSKLEPRFYSSESEFSTEVRCIEFSPYNENLFLVGCSDGCSKLYHVKLAKPLMTIYVPKAEAIENLQWSVTDPTVFCILTSHSTLYLWNIMEDSKNPISSYIFENCRVTSFIFASFDGALNSDKNSSLLIGKDNGEIEVYEFGKSGNHQDFVKQLEYLKNL